MAKKKSTQKVNKAAQIRAYLEAHPKIMPSEAAAALQKQGLDVNAQYISVVKNSSKKKKKPPAKRATGPLKRSASKSDRISVDSIVKAKRLIKEIGSIDEARLALDALEKLAD